MNSIRIPGFVWVILIAVAVVGCETYLANPLYGEIAVVALMGAAKALNLGTKEIEDMLAMLRKMQLSHPQERGMAPSVEVPKPPNKVARWLLG